MACDPSMVWVLAWKGDCKLEDKHKNWNLEVRYSKLWFMLS